MRRWSALGVLAAVALAAAAAPGASAAPVPGSTCTLFPADNVWHADVSTLPVHPSGGAWLASMGGPTARLHPDFGPAGEGEQPYGIPYTVVAGDHARVPVAFQYAAESDLGPYPFGPDTPVEGGSDRHALMVDRDRCVLYELFAATYDPILSTAGSGAVWDLRSNALRPDGWTSADAAGLPILPGLLRRDEVAAGNVDHAIRMTARRTDRSYVWPARHHAGAARDPGLPPMGARFRLEAAFDVSRFRADTQVVLRAMQRHGLILADNGSDWYFTGTSEPGWEPAMLDELKSVPAGAFEAVDASSLMVDADSGRVRAAAVAPTSTTTTTGPATTTMAPPAPTAAAATGAPSSTVRPTTTVPSTTTTPTSAVAPIDQDEAAAEPVGRRVAPPPPARADDGPPLAEILLLVMGAVSAAVAAVGAALRLRRRRRHHRLRPHHSA